MSDSREAAEARAKAHEVLDNPALCFEDGSDNPHQHPACDRLTVLLVSHARELAEANGEVERLHEQLADAGVVEVSPGHWRFTMVEKLGKALADLATLRAERDAAVRERDEQRREAKQWHEVMCAVDEERIATRSRLDEAVRLLRDVCPPESFGTGSLGVAIKAAHAFLAASQPSPSTPVPLETGGGACRRCSECPDGPHHWIDAEVSDADDPTHDCKHCDAVGEECGDCEGDGEAEGGKGMCPTCDGHGVVLVEGERRERCESGCTEPVTQHDVDGVPLCQGCWDELAVEKEPGIVGRHWIEPSLAVANRPRNAVTSAPEPAPRTPDAAGTGDVLVPQPMKFDRKPWTCRCNKKHEADDVGPCRRCKDYPPWPPKEDEDRWNKLLASPVAAPPREPEAGRWPPVGLYRHRDGGEYLFDGHGEHDRMSATFFWRSVPSNWWPTESFTDGTLTFVRHAPPPEITSAPGVSKTETTGVLPGACAKCGDPQERHVGPGGGCLKCLNCEWFVAPAPTPEPATPGSGEATWVSVRAEVLAEAVAVVREYARQLDRPDVPAQARIAVREAANRIERLAPTNTETPKEPA